ncbi:MAG TPA: ATP-dependent DNA helicase UvrD2, partial [Candidatus Lustribacter sp.]|nr:ATP-dependent DNA helicase UvrD2 [Candidatus Lustribacter sp.]
VRNYRSTPQIVGLANTVMRSPRSAGATAGSVELVAQSAGGAAPTLTGYADDPAEADGVAAAIAGLVQAGRRPAEIAVLFRTNAQSEAVESALSQAGVPYLVRGGERFFARKEVRAAVLLLRGAARSDDGERPLGELVRDVLGGAGWTEAPPSAAGAVRERWESLAALAALADDLVATTAQARLPDLVRELDERAAASHAPAVQGVTLASLHAAKGLEWDVVFVVGCSDGFIPITMADTSEAILEERRLLYVGLTRARHELRLSWGAARTPGARASRRPSRFLDVAAGILGEGARSTAKSPASVRGGAAPKVAKVAKVAKRTTCRSCGVDLVTAAARKVGRCADCPPTYDPATFEALRSWRLDTAREASVPAYVIFTDATLTVIAERTPASLTELASISGVGARKLDQYGAAVLGVLHGSGDEKP